jgi:hypothetical protein
VVSKSNDQTWGQKIARGHAWDDHRGEFDVINRDDFAELIDGIILNPSDSKPLPRGRTAYWDDAEQAIVITDPYSYDGGTAYKPRHGKANFNGL